MADVLSVRPENYRGLADSYHIAGNETLFARRKPVHHSAADALKVAHTPADITWLHHRMNERGILICYSKPALGASPDCKGKIAKLPTGSNVGPPDNPNYSHVQYPRGSP